MSARPKPPPELAGLTVCRLIPYGLWNRRPLPEHLRAPLSAATSRAQLRSDIADAIATNLVEHACNGETLSREAILEELALAVDGGFFIFGRWQAAASGDGSPPSATGCN